MLITYVETEQLVWTDLRSTLVNVLLNTKDVSARVNINTLVTQRDLANKVTFIGF